MKNILPLLVFLLIFFSHCLTAQENVDCDDPLVLCGASPFTFDPLNGSGINDFSGQNYCLNDEVNSIWIELNISEYGYLTFVITPLGQYQDLDFLVFKMDDTGCQGKELVRCMASGESAGSPSEPCEGPTGLAHGEGDTIEEIGCDPGDNNFLAPLDVDTGERFLLMVSDFGQSDEGFTIDFGGSARLECVDFTSGTLDPMPKSELNSYFSNETNQLSIEILSTEYQGAKLNVYHISGQQIFEQNDLQIGIQTFDLQDLQLGNYFYTIQKAGKRTTDRFAKLR